MVKGGGEEGEACEGDGAGNGILEVVELEPLEGKECVCVGEVMRARVLIEVGSGI